MKPLSLSLFDCGPPLPCSPEFNMARYVMAAGKAVPDKTALLVLAGDAGDVAERWSYGGLDRAIRGTAAGLQAMGLRRGDRVALRMGNVSDFPILFFGTIAAGGIAVPTSSQLTEGEFARLGADMTPRFVAIADDLALAEVPAGAAVLGPDDWAALRATSPLDYAPTAADDPAFLIYTSGTSGRPKGVLHAQRSAWARRMMWSGWYDLGPDDVMLHSGAFNWTYTLGTGLTDPWAAGATSLIHSGPLAAETLPHLAERHGATILAAVPGVYRRILRGDDDLPARLGTLRHGLTAGERMPDTLADTWRTRTGKPIFEALGMSEISTYLSSSPTTPPRPGTSGRPQAGRRVAVLDGNAPAPVGVPGDLAISRRDPALMLGYWKAPDRTDAAMRGEWFVTGDRAEMDRDGYITYLGRGDDVMTALGYRVSPQEVEEALASHPGVSEVGVAEVTVRDDLTLIAAFIVTADPSLDDDALASHAKERLAPYKCPRVWVRRSSLPRTANGKLIRRALTEGYRESEHLAGDQTG